MSDNRLNINKDIVVRILNLPAVRDNWDRVYNFVKDFMVSLEISENVYTNLLIAVEEIFVNVSSYAYPNSIGNINISLEYNKLSKIITIVFKDSGIPFDPTKKSQPNIKASPEKRKIGGLGIYMVKKISDTMEYSYSNNQNILTITKKIINNREMDTLEINKTREQNKVTYDIVGRIDTQTSPDLQDEIDRTFEEAEKEYDNKMELLLNFAQVEYLSSAGLRTILYIKKRIDTMNESSLKIVNVSPNVMEVFNMTGFNDFLDLNS